MWVIANTNIMFWITQDDKTFLTHSTRNIKNCLIMDIFNFLFIHETLPQIQPVDSITHGGPDHRDDDSIYFFSGPKQLQTLDYSVCKKRNAS